MDIPFIDVTNENRMLKDEIVHLVQDLIERGDYVRGQEVEKCEQEMANYCGTKYAVGVNCGTDALILSLKAIGIQPGDEVITSANSFIATIAAIVWIGAKPVLVDVDKSYNMDSEKIEDKITNKTKAIIPVHFTGRIANMAKINEIAKKHKLRVIEDAAQAFGASLNNQRAGSFGDLGCFSFFPTKNISVIGDGGAIVTNNEALYKRLKLLTDFGRQDRDRIVLNGINSRLDSLQAGILNLKFPHYANWIRRRNEIARMYADGLKDYFDVPVSNPETEVQVYHLYIAKIKNESISNSLLQKRLKKQGIDVRIHYPIPMHLQEGYDFLGYKKGDFPYCESLCEKTLTFPMYTSLKDDDIKRVIAITRRQIEEIGGMK